MSTFAQLSGLRGGAGVVRVIGHRGARGVMPENTLEGFSFTLATGVQVLEFDVVMTADGVPVVTHNHHLANSATRDAQGRWLTGAERKVAEMTFAEIRALDVGGLDGRTAYGQRFPDQAFLSGIRVPRLGDLLDLCASHGENAPYLLLELKSDPALMRDDAARADLVAAAVSDVRRYRMESRTVMHSFDWALLDECRRQAPDLPTSYLSQLPENADDPGEDSAKSVGPDYQGLTTTLPQTVAAAGGQLWCPYYLDVTPELVAEAHDLGLSVLTWTVNETDDIRRMAATGVDGIVTDYPGRTQRVLIDMGLTWN
ncbi:glycerophosphodiester phosphodiesterase [Ruegeria pomeroyi]|uniref:glycerophosphodiester phosphodiesterase n=1 Tax=Ruegeria pomeroyi TaxID=89184 RepID=UPI001F262B4B|nr:glycerophosphodiester phosphodiesterase [Ruegeria pomeroyi]MCE8507452.1 glycerophosphodiester phosphodiesterase [Ruegeria pomeroyi]